MTRKLSQTCKHGHLYTDETTHTEIRNGRSVRVCRTCRNYRMGKYREASRSDGVPYSPAKGAMERFTSKLRLSQNGCWEWDGWTTSVGYGHFTYNGKFILAHRFAYLACNGELYPDLDIHHTCENKSCVNPAHLVQITKKEHVRLTPTSGVWRQSVRTHCPQNHPYNDENTYYYRHSSGSIKRECRACGRIRAKQRRDRSKFLG